MVSDSEPRYRLVDSQGNVVGTLYAKSGGTLALQEGSSGSDNEIELQTDGTLQTDSLSTNQIDNSGVPIETGDAFDFTDISSGSTLLLAESNIDSDQEFSEGIQMTSSVGTSATTIFDGSAITSGLSGARVTIQGRSASGQENFNDVVHYLFNGPATTISSVEESGASTRTYSVDSGALKLALGSDPAPITAKGDVFRILP